MIGALPRLAAADMMIGAAPRLLLAEAREIFAHAAKNAPRSLQKTIGPSEIGTPCARRLAYRLADAPEHNERDAWRPTVGTATHAWIAEALAEHNIAHRAKHGFSRYLIEQRVSVGFIRWVEITGSSDCYDRITAEVIDWKVVGTTSLKDARRAGGSAIHKVGYRVQAHLYGSGFVAAGLPVHGVNVVYLPSSGELRESVIQHEAYDASVAAGAIARANAIATAMDAAGAENVIGGLPRADDFCTYCPFFSPGASPEHVWDGCPGVPLVRNDFDDTPNSGSLALQLV